MPTSPFAAPLGSPVFRWFDDSGDPAAAYQLGTYAAGTSTPLATYPTYADAIAGSNSNTNPVILDADGAAQVWVQASYYKLVMMLPVAQGSGVVYTQDYVSVAVPGTALGGQWIPLVAQGASQILYVSATSFRVTSTDQTALLHVGRRIRTVNSGGVVTSTIVASAFTASNTNITLVNDGAGVLDSGMSAVSYGLLSYAAPSYLDPGTGFGVEKIGNQAAIGGAAKVTGWSAYSDPLSEWDGTNNRWIPKYPGRYLITVSLELSDSAGGAVTLEVRKNGLTALGQSRMTLAAGSVINTIHANVMLTHAPTTTTYMEVWMTGTGTTTVLASSGSGMLIARLQRVG